MKLHALTKCILMKIKELIYYEINNNRATSVHINVNRLTKTEFDDLIKIVYSNEYENNKNRYFTYELSYRSGR